MQLQRFATVLVDQCTHTLYVRTIRFVERFVAIRLLDSSMDARPFFRTALADLACCTDHHLAPIRCDLAGITLRFEG